MKATSGNQRLINHHHPHQPPLDPSSALPRNASQPRTNNGSREALVDVKDRFDQPNNSSRLSAVNGQLRETGTLLPQNVNPVELLARCVNQNGVPLDSRGKNDRQVTQKLSLGLESTRTVNSQTVTNSKHLVLPAVKSLDEKEASTSCLPGRHFTAKPNLQTGSSPDQLSHKAGQLNWFLRANTSTSQDSLLMKPNR